MSFAQNLSSDLSNTESTKLSKEEIEKIFAKYTKHFSDFLSGTYSNKEEEKGERDRKDCN